ncbi:MAG: 50S ribosomal protein L22 [Patescibacteria group bacterium]
MTKAQLNNYHQTPRKVRLAADLVRGQTVAEALLRLKFMTKRAAAPLTKLIKSAVANLPANQSRSTDQLLIKNIAVDKGVVAKRFRARSRGQASRINKRSSRIRVILEAKS